MQSLIFIPAKCTCIKYISDKCMYLAYCLHLVGVTEVIGKDPEFFQKSRSSQNGDMEQVKHRRHESIRRHRTKN